MIFLAFLIATVFVVAFSYYTRRGSGINQRPRGSEHSRMSSAETDDDYRN